MAKIKSGKILSAALYLVLACYAQSALAAFTPLKNFGNNPGQLSASYYQPGNKHPAIVVLLHGCGQNGEQLAQQSGLYGLAQQHSFALLLVQQNRGNNAKTCFNWFSEQDNQRDQGESLSIKNMVQTLKSRLASQKIYILGLSAGGAMTSAMLAHYPDLFDAGAVIAGIPYPCADGLIKAISCMRSGPAQPATELTAAVQSGLPTQQHWPRLSVWTGRDDNIVNPQNARHLSEQWAALSHCANKPKVKENDGYQISEWRNRQQQVVVELVELAHLGHGMAVNPASEHGGEPGPYLLAAPISAATHIIKFWHLQQDML